MFDMITRIVPRGLLFGLSLYLGVVLIWLQPMVETRLAEKIYIPTCETQIINAHRDRVNQEAERQRRELQLAEPFIDLSTDFLNELGAAMGQPGLGDAARSAQLPTPPDFTSTSELANSACGRAVGQVFDDMRWQMLAHIATGRAYHPDAINQIGSEAAGLAASTPSIGN